VKTKLTRILAVVAIAMVAACVAASPASAQAAYAGSFTLTQDATWGSAKLPAGEYSFVLESMGIPAKIVVRGPHGAQFVNTVASDRISADQPSNLKIQHRGTTRFVSEINLAELKLQLRYQGPKLPKDEQLAMGPASTETVLIASAK
jgi:hypothetical protein